MQSIIAVEMEMTSDLDIKPFILLAPYLIII